MLRHLSAFLLLHIGLFLSREPPLLRQARLTSSGKWYAEGYGSVAAVPGHYLGSALLRCALCNFHEVAVSSDTENL